MARWKGCKNKQCYEKGNRAIVAGGDTYSIVCLQFSTCAQRAMYNTEKVYEIQILMFFLPLQTRPEGYSHECHSQC